MTRIKKLLFTLSTLSLAGFFIWVLPMFSYGRHQFAAAHNATQREITIITDVFDKLRFQTTLTLWFLLFIYLLFALTMVCDWVQNRNT